MCWRRSTSLGTAGFDLSAPANTFPPTGSRSGYPTSEIRDAYLRNGADQGLAFYERTLPTRPSKPN